MESNNKKFYTIFWFGTQRPSVEQEKKLNEGDTIKDVLYFDNDELNKCLQCLQLTSNENVLLVTNGMASNTIILDENILTQVHNLHHVKGIYADTTYCHRYASQRFPKV
jgi:hypothetical protein